MAVLKVTDASGRQAQHQLNNVNEVRRARLEIEKECDGDFDQIYNRALEVQKKSTAKLVSRPDPAKITMAEIDQDRREKRL